MVMFQTGSYVSLPENKHQFSEVATFDSLAGASTVTLAIRRRAEAAWQVWANDQSRHDIKLHQPFWGDIPLNYTCTNHSDPPLFWTVSSRSWHYLVHQVLLDGATQMWAPKVPIRGLGQLTQATQQSGKRAEASGGQTGAVQPMV